MDNMTAKVSCFARAYHYKNNSIHIFTDDIAEKLLGEDYHQIAKSISYYLKKVDFEQLVMSISEIISEGSAICFDYPSVDESAETRKTQMLASEAGEQMKAVYSYKEIGMILDKHGFKIEEHLDENDMTYRYFREYNQANPMHQMNAPVGVGYVYAVKR